jgi:hypothetical protein
MPRRETILSVFVASPSDVAEERAALEDVVRELNSTWGRPLGCRLDLVRWETHAIPGLGIDAQEVIDRSVPQDADIFIGMLWSRFGTPTHRAESGTREEFDRAVARYRRDQSSVRIMFYFKDEPLAPSQLDPDQLRQIHEFRRELGQLGGLYWKFNTLEEFQNLVRVHLSRVAQEWAQTFGGSAGIASAGDGPATPSSPPSTDAERENEEEEEGLLDLVEQANDAFAKLMELSERMTTAIRELGERIAQRTEEFQELHPERGSYDVKSAKRISARAAADLTEYSARTELDIPIFADALAAAMASLGRAATVSMEFDRPNVSDLRDLLGQSRSLRDTLAETNRNLGSFRDSIAGTPRVTSDFNRAKRRALSTMASLLREFEVGVSHVGELEESLERIIQRFNDRDGKNV